MAWKKHSYVDHVEIYLIFAVLFVFILKMNEMASKLPTVENFATNTSININVRRIGKFKKFDCDKSVVLCNTSVDCLAVCRMSNSTYDCNMGRCVKQKQKAITTANNLTCDTAHGLYPAYQNFSELTEGFWTCVSMYPELWTDDNQLVMGVCNDGTLNTNVLDHSPSLKDCNCPAGKSLYYYAGIKATATVLPIPVCITNSEVQYYPGYLPVTDETSENLQSFHVGRAIGEAP